VILNGKIEFLPKIGHNWLKMCQKQWKIDQHFTPQIVIKFDYQKGDSGSAGMLGKKCVIIGALKFDMKITQNWSPTWKMTKNDQKSQLIKNQKKWKIRKSEKVTKLKSSKMTKSENVKHQKSVKIHQKSWKPVLRPKTQKTGVHAVWQKCPHQMARKTRKVTFPPLSDIPPLFWPIFCFDHFWWFPFYHFYCFCVFPFSCFCHFFWFCHFWSFCVLIIFDPIYVIRP